MVLPSLLDRVGLDVPRWAWWGEAGELFTALVRRGEGGSGEAVRDLCLTCVSVPIWGKDGVIILDGSGSI